MSLFDRPSAPPAHPSTTSPRRDRPASLCCTLAAFPRPEASTWRWRSGRRPDLPPVSSIQVLRRHMSVFDRPSAPLAHPSATSPRRNRPASLCCTLAASSRDVWRMHMRPTDRALALWFALVWRKSSIHSRAADAGKGIGPVSSPGLQITLRPVFSPCAQKSLWLPLALDSRPTAVQKLTSSEK